MEADLQYRKMLKIFILHMTSQYTSKYMLSRVTIFPKFAHGHFLKYSQICLNQPANKNLKSGCVGQMAAMDRQIMVKNILAGTFQVTF